jgi:hypothetical protein
MAGFRFAMPNVSLKRIPRTLLSQAISRPNLRGNPTAKDPDTVALEKSLTDVLGLKVQLAHKGQGGQLRIDYKTLEQLDELCRLLGDNR